MSDGRCVYCGEPVDDHPDGDLCEPCRDGQPAECKCGMLLEAGDYGTCDDCLT